MDFMLQRTTKVTRGYTYNFYTLDPRDTGKPTVLFLHGWPDCAKLWNNTIKSYIRRAGYGAIAIDCLGYAGTSKPLSPEEYSWGLVTQDICEILDSVGIDKVVVAGHDWGSVLTSRFYSFHPERVTGLILLNVAYRPPTGDRFNLEQALVSTRQSFGYSFYEYWTLFTSPDGPHLCQENAGHLWDIMHGTKDTIMKTSCTPDGIRKALTSGTKYPVEDYADPAHNPSATAIREEFVARIKKDGFDAPMQYYHAAVNNIQSEVEAKVKDNQVVKVPTLFIAATEDVVCIASLIELVRHLIPDLEVVGIEAGHWCMMKKPHELGMALVYWLEKNLHRF